MGKVGEILDRGKLRITAAQYRGSFRSGTRFGLDPSPIALLAPLAPLVWFAIVYTVIRPLAAGPVVDSWIYRRAVKNLAAGVLALPGFTAAMPVAQIAYGALWSRLFGWSYPALDLSVALLGLAGAMLFYPLARRCNADRTGATLATALLAASPCYLFLSFSFMTDVPFVALMIAAHLMFATAEQGRAQRWMWGCAALLIVAFLVRPFALAAIAGSAGAIMLAGEPGRRLGFGRSLVTPFIVAVAICVLVWWWLTAMRPAPWMLDLRKHNLSYLYLVPVRVYFTDAMLAPLLYLGLVLSPLALPYLFSKRWRLGVAIAAALAAVALPLLLADPGARSIPELSCCGGWANALVLRGPLRFVWSDQRLRLAVLLVAIGGVAGMTLAALEIRAPTRGFLAVMISAAIYWAGMIPLWMFNDRYYLAMLPAGCLLLAVARRPQGLASRVTSLALLAVVGWFALGGAYAQQRGLDTVIMVRDALLNDGVPRSAIDAGYPLNGNDLYRDARPGERETLSTEAGIPLITSKELSQYTIAAAPVSGTVILRRFGWPGSWGFGRRPLYLLKRIAATRLPSGPSDIAGRPGALPSHTVPPGAPPFVLIFVRLAAMGLMMLAPLALVLTTFGMPQLGFTSARRW
ncbi:MAG: glycosyltransferase family 39 protein [Candidatus Binataceae bacterium]